MNIAVDYGNTTAKVGVFENGELREKMVFTKVKDIGDFIASRPAENIIVSSVSFPAEELLSRSGAKGSKLSLSYQTPLPVKISYATPKTLGVDRIAAVCGALEVFPGQDCLVIDAGTAITYEFLDSHGTYHGGGISPGVSMRFEALNHFTARLPLVNPVQRPPLVGNSTESCMQSGVIHGVRAEVDGIIAQYLDQFPDIKSILCGGDVVFLEKELKHPVFVSPELVLIGLNRILRHNL